MQSFLLFMIAMLNLTAFFAMGLDKRFVIHGHRRIPEKRLLLFAALGGSFGAVIGMLLFRHKTQKARFYIGLPLLLCGHILLVYAILQFV